MSKIESKAITPVYKHINKNTTNTAKTTPEFSEEHCWAILENFFKTKGFVNHQINSFNNFVNFGISKILSEEPEIVIDLEDIHYSVSFTDVYVPKPTIIEEDRTLREVYYPSEARQRDLTYDSPVYVTVIEKTIYKNSDKPPTINKHLRTVLCRIPIMLQSSKCHLSNFSKDQLVEAGECENDPGGYFLIKGKERVLISQVRCVYNIPLVYDQKAGEKYKYIAEVRSMSESTGHSVLIQALFGSDDRTIVFSLPYIKENIPVGVVFKAYGYVTDEEIKNIIGLPETEKTEKYLKLILRDSYFTQTQEEALNYMGKFAIHLIKEEERYNYAYQVVDGELFPHLGISATTKEKAYYLGYILNKLISTAIGIRKEDDRDNYMNKRLEPAGILCYDLFRQLFKRYTSTIYSTLEKKKQNFDAISIISRLNLITLGLRSSFATGNWGVKKNNYIRVGVSQVLSRLSYPGFLSHLRRINIQIGKESKNSKIRQINPSQIMYICPHECFDPETPILLFNGTVKLAKNIIVGDILVSDTGAPTRVRSTCSGINDMYEICQENGMNYTVTENHILTLKILEYKTIIFENNVYKTKIFDKTKLNYTYSVFTTEKLAISYLNNVVDYDDTIDIKLSDYIDLPINVKSNLVGFKWNSKDITNISTKKKGLGNFVGWQLEGNGRFLLPDYTVVHNTPEGAGIGLVMNMSLSTDISEKTPTFLVRDIIEKAQNIILLSEYVNDMNENTIETKPTKIFLNGIILGITETPEKLIEELKYYRVCKLLPYDVSISFNNVDNEILVFCDEGRMIRPLLTVDKTGKLKAKVSDGTDWETLIQKGLIEYVDHYEINNAVIAMDLKDLTKYKNNYCEISPVMMLGVMASAIPFADHNQAPRVCYQCLDPDELVLMANNDKKRIGDIAVGDKVITVDPITCKQTISTVINQYVKHTDKKIVKVTTVSGRTIICTYDHLFLTENGWKQAYELICNNGTNESVCIIPPISDSNINLDNNLEYKLEYELEILFAEYIRICFFTNLTPTKTDFINWAKNITVKDRALFIKVSHVEEVTNHSQYISDITIESENHSFIAGDSFCVHNSSMGKQAMGVYALSHNIRPDTAVNILSYPQRALVSSIPSKIMGLHDMPHGINAIVAIMCYTGYNQEDSVIVNKSAIDRGLFWADMYHVYTEEEKKSGTYDFEKICLPPLDKRKKDANYVMLDNNGVIKKGSYVEKGDVLIGKIFIHSDKNGDEEISDCSLIVKKGEEGVVDKIFVSTNPNGYKLVKIVIRSKKIPEVGDKCACYDPETEVLTKNGWKYVYEVTLEDEVACLVKGEELQYHKPTEVQEYDYEGDMYYVDSSKVNLLVTPNHRMYTGNSHRQNYLIQRADAIYGKSRSYKNNISIWNPKPEFEELFTDIDTGEQYFILPGYEELEHLYINLEAWCLFLGIWYAEGSCSISYLPTGGISCRKVSIAANKDRVKDQLEKCMEEIPLKWTYHTTHGKITHWCCHDKRLIYYLRPLSVGAINKILPKWCFALDMHHARQFIHGMCLGDAHFMPGTTTVRYGTSSIKLRDDLNQLCLHAGWGCNYYLMSPAGTKNIILGQETTTTADHWKITICKTQTNPLVNKYISHGKQLDRWVEYSGKVYCCTVPTREGIIYVRRNGKSIWCGQSRSSQKGVLGMIYSQEDMPFTSSGVVPDIIINSHCIPSRMTIAQLIECVLGKLCAIRGEYSDATPFTKNSVGVADEICDELGKHGYEKYGTEVMFNGFTGEKLDSRIFIGPTYYQRLKHLVSEKIHARAKGEVTTLTRQPSQGKILAQVIIKILLV